MALTLRATKGAKLTNTEADDNLSGLADGSNMTLPFNIGSGKLIVGTDGAVSLSGSVTQNGNLTVDTASVPTLTLSSPGVNSGGLIKFTASNTQLNWQISQQTFVVGALEFTPSTAGGGTTFSTPIAILTSSGLTHGTPGALRIPDGARIGADSTNNLLDDASTGAGSATLYIGNASINVTSDIRRKRDVVDTKVNASAVLGKLRVVDHYWRDPSDASFHNRNSRGSWVNLIAQECVDLVPWAVNAPNRYCRTCRAGQPCADHPSPWVIDFAHLVPLLIKGWQELNARVRALELI